MTSTVIACPSCGTKNRLPASAGGHPRCAHCKVDLPWLVEADDASFAAVVTDSQVPVLVDCWADWCGPCHALAPAIEEISRRYAGRLKVAKVDVDASQATARRLQVQGIPALFFYKDGVVVDSKVGAMGVAALDRWLATQLA